MPRMTVEISFEMPQGATSDDVLDYIVTELSCAGGSRHPSDPLFNSLSDVKVKVKRNTSIQAQRHA